MIIDNLAADTRLIAVADVTAAYNMFGASSNEEFATFADPANHTAQIIVAHFFVIEYMLLGPLFQPIRDSFRFRKRIVAIWVRQVAESLPEELQPNMDWPLRFPGTMQRPFDQI